MAYMNAEVEFQDVTNCFCILSIDENPIVNLAVLFLRTTVNKKKKLFLLDPACYWQQRFFFTTCAIVFGRFDARPAIRS
jgi:hypothetical protein